MTPEMKVAVIRGAYLAFLSAGGAFFTSLGLGYTLADAGIAAGSAAFIALGWRGAEGVKDSRSAGGTA